jgi:hypothetical protein
MIITTEVSGVVGKQTMSNGGIGRLRQSPDGSLVVTGGGGYFQEAVRNGKVFAVANQAGVTSQAGLSATTPVLTLANPSGSGVNCILWYAGASFSVAFAAAAAVWAAVGTNPAAAAVTGTLTTAHRNLLLGGGNPAVVPMLAATLPAAPVAVSLLGMGLTGAITTVPQLQTLERWFNGAIILQPGTNFSIQTSTASGASGTFCEYIWEEVPA